METLKAVRELGLPDWAIGAGFIRNAVWDHLHGFDMITPLADIDVLYFEPGDLSKERELDIEATLKAISPDRPWSVRNQARMHLRNNDAPYASTEDALRYWLETPTCVAARLETDNSLTLFSPYGLSDLMEMRASLTKHGETRIEQYKARMKEKNWPSIWPKVVVTDC